MSVLTGSSTEIIKEKWRDNQSFMHRNAIKLLVKWLKTIERSKKKSCRFGVLAWRRSAGVFSELKFHENNSPQYFEHVTAKTGKIIFVPDVVIFHQGYPKYIIEVVHKNPPSNDKLFEIVQFFHGYDTEVYTVDAYQIMAQVGIPKSLNFKKAA